LRDIDKHTIATMCCGSYYRPQLSTRAQANDDAVAESSVMRLLTFLGAFAMILAICCCVLLGTVGWFVVGFGVMTDCTDNYSCSTQGCSPCAGAGRWLEIGAITQWLLAALGVGVLVRTVADARVSRLLICAPVILLASAITFVGTNWRANESYCQPGGADYSSSYCSASS
jgi:hypothetical protein